MRLYQYIINTSPADTTTTTVYICRRCVIVGKLGRLSCCGRGGYWFNNCGRTRNSKFYHTWYEGIQACKEQSQSKTVIAQQRGVDSSQGVGIAKYGSGLLPTKYFAFTSASAYTEDNAPITPAASTLMATTLTHTSPSSRGCVKLLGFAVHIIFWCITLF